VLRPEMAQRSDHAITYQTARPAPCFTRCPISVSRRRCTLTVLRLAPVMSVASISRGVSKGVAVAKTTPISRPAASKADTLLAVVL
jgi:hypothetical protein